MPHALVLGQKAVMVGAQRLVPWLLADLLVHSSSVLTDDV